jgi:hypothetical protein
MNYGDFSSVVQLGVALHVGTALLQSYGDLGVAPFVRALDRLRGLIRSGDIATRNNNLEEQLSHLESRYEVFKIQLFQEYRKYVCINSAVAVALAISLIVIAYNADNEITEDRTWTTIFIVFLSLFPAPLTLGVLWFDANHELEPMKAEADRLEILALANQQP